MQQKLIWSLGQEDPLEKEMATHSSILAWEIPWTEESDRLQFMGSQRIGHNSATKQQQSNHTVKILGLTHCKSSFPQGHAYWVSCSLFPKQVPHLNLLFASLIKIKTSYSARVLVNWRANVIKNINANVGAEVTHIYTNCIQLVLNIFTYMSTL